jgi:pimeloyl-ACP methyl ester carboxylesterase
MAVNMTKIGNLDVRSWDIGSGKPLLYLHGFEHHPGDASFLQKLAKNRRVVAPEHPGFGDSTGIEDMRSIFDIALHYRRVVETLIGSEPIDVIGHSLGGMFAAEFAAISPYLVRKLVLVDSFGMWLDEEPAADPFGLLPAQIEKAKWFDPANAPKPEPCALASDNKGEVAIFRTKNLGSATKFLMPLPDRGLSRRLNLIKAPTLVIHGESDGFVPRSYSEAIAAGIKDAKVKIIAKAGHLPMLEQEDDFLAATEEFLK